LLSSLLMLQHIGEVEAAERIFKALVRVLSERQIRTPDLGGTGTTQTFARAIIDELR